MMAEDAAKVVRTYFNAWKANDFATLRSVLADDVHFVGPLGRVYNVDEVAGSWGYLCLWERRCMACKRRKR